MYILPFLLISVGIVIFDMVTKLMVTNNMTLGQTIPVIEDVFHITYIENTGASFGIFPGARWFFVVVTVLLIAGVLIYTIHEKENNKIYLLGVSFMIGGGIGNLIDRVLIGSVTDFFDFCLINFAIFNVADCFVVVGVILLAIYVIMAEMKEKKENGKA